MGQDVEELRSDIERNRADLGQTLDAIGDRISPGRMVTRQRNRMTEGWRSLRYRVMGTVDDATTSVSGTASSVADKVGPDAVRRQTEGSPLGAGLIAFGIGAVAAALIPPSQKEGQLAQTIKEKAEPLTSTVAEAGREIAEDLKGQATEAGQELKSTATDAAGQVTDRAKTAADDVRQGQSSSTPTI
jgi:gas vesicle protein